MDPERLLRRATPRSAALPGLGLLARAGLREAKNGGSCEKTELRSLLFRGLCRDSRGKLVGVSGSGSPQKHGTLLPQHSFLDLLAASRTTTRVPKQLKPHGQALPCGDPCRERAAAHFRNKSASRGFTCMRNCGDA